MKKASLHKAIALAMTAAGMSNAMASTTMYNLYQAYSVPTVINPGSTDGWTWSDSSEKGTTAGAVLNAWAGTAGYNTNPADPRPFNYVGSSALNWAAHITQAGDSLQISQADSFARYGVYADIDTGGGAWQDSSAAQIGWGHNTDIGLFKSDVSTSVTLKLSGIYNAANPPTTGAGAMVSNFGITVFVGMDTVVPVLASDGYSHHSKWNDANDTDPNVLDPYAKSNPFKTQGVTYVDGLGTNTPGNVSYMTGVTSGNGFTFAAQANVIYSIYLGGYRLTGWNTGHDGYALDISTTPVPVPAAVWLMGSGLSGLLVYGRRKKPEPSV